MAILHSMAEEGKLYINQFNKIYLNFFFNSIVPAKDIPIPISGFYLRELFAVISSIPSTVLYNEETQAAKVLKHTTF